MKTLLVLASHPGLADAVRAALPPDQYRVMHYLNLEDAEPLLGAGLLDASCSTSNRTRHTPSG